MFLPHSFVPPPVGRNDIEPNLFPFKGAGKAVLAGREEEVNKALHLYAATELRKAYGAGDGQLASLGMLDCWMYKSLRTRWFLASVWGVGTLHWRSGRSRSLGDPIVDALCLGASSYCERRVVAQPPPSLTTPTLEPLRFLSPKGRLVSSAWSQAC